MADAEFEAARAELRDALAPTIERIDEIYRMVGVLTGAFAPDVPAAKIAAERSIFAQVLRTPVDPNGVDPNGLGQLASDTSGRVAQLVTKVDALTAEVAAIKAALAK